MVVKHSLYVSANHAPGRPKGSKNKPRFSSGTVIPDTQSSESSTISANSITPQSFHQALQQATANIAAGFPAVNSTTRTEPSRTQLLPANTDETTPKNKGGRPRGSKNKPKDAAMQAHMTTPSFTGAAIANMIPHQDGGSPLKRRPGRPRKESLAPVAAVLSPQVAGLTPEERAVLEAYRAVRASQTPAAAPVAPTAATAPTAPITPITPATGDKRKRGRPKRSPAHPTVGDAENAVGSASAVPTTVSSSTMQIDSPSIAAAVASSISQAPESTTASVSAKPPPAKRQRRPKDAAASPAKRKSIQDQSSIAQQSPSVPAPPPVNQTLNQTHQSPAIQPSSISPTFPSSAATSNTLSQQHPNSLRTPSQTQQTQQTNTTHTLSQMSMPPQRPKPTGLAAHYEQFEAASKQQNSPAQAQNPNRDMTENHNLISRLGMPTSGQTTPSYFAQTHRSSTGGMGYGQGYGAQQQYHPSQNSPQLDGFRTQSNGNITPQQQKTFPPQAQNHSNNHYGSFNSPDLFDMSSLETRNGSVGSSAYSGISRAPANRVPNPGFGGNGNRIGDGFSSDLSEQELRERILRGIGRR